MAASLMAEVQYYSRSHGKTYLVLLMLANWSGEDHRTVETTTTQLANACHISYRSAFRQLTKLYELGEIQHVGFRRFDEVREIGESDKFSLFLVPLGPQSIANRGK